MKITDIIMLLEDIRETEGNINIDLVTLGEEIFDIYPGDELELKECILNSIY